MTIGSQGAGAQGARAQGVSARGIGVRYGAAVALEGVDLVAGPGTVTAVTGHSGAGKTSLLWALAGLLPSGVDGEIEIGPRSLVAQGSALSTILTARECVALPLLDLGVSGADAVASADRALAEVRLEESGSHLSEELSGGQQQRVAVARGIARTRALLARGAAVLLADEPTSELDHDNRERVVALLRGLADEGACVVVTTHDPEVAEAADAVLALDV